MEIHYKHPRAAKKIGKAIKNTLDPPFIVLCIGTDRCIGDSLGPIVGDELKIHHFPYPVYGTVEHPIHAINIADRIAGIQMRHPDLPILALDASLGKNNSIGNILFRKGAVSPGKGVGKKLPDVGDYSLIGIVDTYSDLDELTIHQVRLHLIYEMAKVVTKSLFEVIKKT